MEQTGGTRLQAELQAEQRILRSIFQVLVAASSRLIWTWCLVARRRRHGLGLSTMGPEGQPNRGTRFRRRRHGTRVDGVRSGGVKC